jgi:hypothetical protein
MPKKPSDAGKGNQNPAITPPVTLGDAYAKDDVFMLRVPHEILEAHPNFEDLGDLVEEMNDSPKSPLPSNGDPLEVNARTANEPKLEQLVREQAYLLWEHAGRPEGRSDEFWHQARFENCRERAYALWESERRPEGKADEHWHRAQGSE